MIDDFCRFFQKIEENPFEKIHGMTIGDFQKAKEHIRNCDPCYNRTQRTLAKAPKPTLADGFGEN